MKLETNTRSIVGGGQTTDIHESEIQKLEAIIRDCDIEHKRFQNRLSVVFVYPGMGVGDVYPDLAGCTTEVCAFIEESAVFEKHGIQVIGLSTEPSEPPPGCLKIPFSTGLIPKEGVGAPLEFVNKGDRKYAVRMSFIVGSDGSGIKIDRIEDVVSHVKLCLQLAIDKRLARYRDSALEFLKSGGDGVRPDVHLRELLPNGADSVSIPRVDVTLRLVAKLADSSIISQEAGYISKINKLLVDNGHGELFPSVLAICDREEPAWYLMEAANPIKLDGLAFANKERTVLGDSGKALINNALDKLFVLYQLTRREGAPEVARYHYLDRFLRIPKRADFKDTFDLLVNGDLKGVLEKPVVLEESYECASYMEQMNFLVDAVDQLIPTWGAFLHGDAHLPNMLLSLDKSEVRFIDPRVVWDGHDVGQPGLGDPLYDLGTLLHSLHVMSAILYAIDIESTSELVRVSEEKEHIRVYPGTLRFVNNPLVEYFLRYLETLLGDDFLGDNWRARLHVNAANALVGWLKYSRAVQTSNAWWAIFVSAMYHLEEGRRAVDTKT